MAQCKEFLNASCGILWGRRPPSAGGGPMLRRRPALRAGRRQNISPSFRRFLIANGISPLQPYSCWREGVLRVTEFQGGFSGGRWKGHCLSGAGFLAGWRRSPMDSSGEFLWRFSGGRGKGAVKRTPKAPLPLKQLIARFPLLRNYLQKE
jgi:hypothetical protein